MITEITPNNFEAEVIKSDKPVLLDFWAQWCGPCRTLSPIVDEIAQENNSVKVCKVNVDNNEKLAEDYGVVNIPTLIVFKDGQLVKKSVGIISKEEISAMLG